MASFGRNLRREREMRSISLEEMSLHTKVSARFLEAIENDRFDLLPGGVFSRSFVLHYARYLGLDEEQVGAEFDHLLGPPRPLDLREVATQREQRAAATPDGWAGRAAPNLKRVLLTALASAVLLGGYAVWEGWRPNWVRASRASREQPPTPLSPALHGPAVQAGKESGDGAPPPRLRLQIDTLGPSWTAAYADGRKMWEATLQAGETRTVAADSSIELRVGNAGDVVLTLNGETQPPLGRKGEVKTVALTERDLKNQ